MSNRSGLKPRTRDGNGLFTPTPNERSQGLPTSYEDAINKGFNEFEKDGKVYKIRFKTRRKPDQFGKRVEIEPVDKWRGRNSKRRGRRPDAEAKLTPDPAVRRETNQVMSDLTSQGKVGHHGMPIMSASHGYDQIVRTKGKAAADAWVKKQAQVGKPVGHVKGNIEGMSIPDHRYLHDVLEKQYERAIQNAGKAATAVFNPILEAINFSMTPAKAIPKPKPKNGNGNGNGKHSNGNGNGKHSNGNGNGNGKYKNGNGKYSNGNGNGKSIPRIDVNPVTNSSQQLVDVLENTVNSKQILPAPRLGLV